MLRPPAVPSSYTLDHHFFPEKGADEHDLLSFRDRIINPWAVYRNQRMADIGLWYWYYLGKQWASIDYDAIFDGVRGAILRDVAPGAPVDMPKPVTNEIDPAVEQTLIAMVQRQWTFKSVATSRDPAIKAAAQVATDLLQYRLDSLSFPDKRLQHAFNFIVGGTGLAYTSHDRSYVKLRTVGAHTAVWCDSCQTKLYSDTVPRATLAAGREGKPFAWSQQAKSVELDDSYDAELMNSAEDLDLVKLAYCPTCEDQARPLKPYSVNQDEAGDADDIFGRSLGLMEPSGSASLEIDTPFEFYPQDGGYLQSVDGLRRFGRRKIRPAEWLEERAPHLIDQLQPDSVQELLHNDPLLGNWDTLAGWSSSLDAGILDHHYNVDEVVELPSIRHPLGRYLMAVKDRAIVDDDLLIPSVIDGDTYYVQRATMSVCQFKLRPREIWGSGLPMSIISPQNRLNGLDGQVIHWRLATGSPNVYMPADMWIDNPVAMDSDYGPGKFVFFQPSVSMPEFTKPEVIPPVLMPDAVYNERDRIQADIRRSHGPHDATIGAAPKNVGTTSGLQLLVDQEMKSNSVREESLIRSMEKAARHLLTMEWLLQTDEEEYRVLGPDKVWSYAQYTGNAIRGQVEVKIERGASIANSLVQRESAREALADKLIPVGPDGGPASPVVRRKLLELYGLDPDLTPDEAYQVDHAQRVWVDFRDNALVRVLDTIDDAMIHWHVLSGHLRTEEGEKLADDAGWDEILRKIAGWQDELRRLEVLDQMTIEFYGGRLFGDEALDAYGAAAVAYDQKKELYQQQATVQQEIQRDPVAAATVGGALGPVAPPTPPPPPIFLPALLQDRVLLVWDKMMAGAGAGAGPGAGGALALPAQAAPVAPGTDLASAPGQALALRTTAGQPDARDPMLYVKFRALVEAYRLTVTGAAAMAMAGAGVGAGAGPAGPAPASNPAQARAQSQSTSAPPPSPEAVASTPDGGKN